MVVASEAELMEDIMEMSCSRIYLSGRKCELRLQQEKWTCVLGPVRCGVCDATVQNGIEIPPMGN